MNALLVRVEYTIVPPQVIISRLNQFIHENETQAQIRWGSVRVETPDEEESHRTDS